MLSSRGISRFQINLSPNRNRGFTLIEVLIALSIFSVMSVMAYSGLRTVLNAQNRTEQAAARLTKAQMAFLLLQQDFEHMAPRGIRGEYGDRESALSVGTGIDYLFAFTRGGSSHPRRPFRSGLYRVAYQVEEGELHRLVWSALDRVDGTEPQAMVLLQGVTDVSFSFLDNDWVSNWPPAGSGTGGNDDALPRAVELRLVLEEWGTITRTFAMPY